MKREYHANLSLVRGEIPQTMGPVDGAGSPELPPSRHGKFPHPTTGPGRTAHLGGRKKERKTPVLAQRGGEQDERCSHGQDQADGERAPTRKERARALRIQAELNGKKQRLA